MLQAAGMVMLFVMLTSTVLWIRAFRRLASGTPLLPIEPRQPVPWGLADPIIAVLISFTLQIGVFALVVGLPNPGEPTKVDMPSLALRLVLMSLSTLATMAISMALIRLRTGATLLDFGFSARHLLADLKLGLIAFVMIAPPVYAMQLVLVQIFPQFHPLIEQLRKEPDALVFMASAFSVMIGAPLVEEYFFRGLLQGWLESLRRGLDSDKILLGVRHPTSERTSANASADAIGAPPSFASLDASNPYASPSPVESTSPELTAELATPTVPRWPMVVSALLFALAHYSHGPAPIPLFFLALGLGYLYQRTHRLTPCITVHFLLNSWTMLLMLLEAYAKPAS